MLRPFHLGNRVARHQAQRGQWTDRRRQEQVGCTTAADRSRIGSRGV